MSQMPHKIPDAAFLVRAVDFETEYWLNDVRLSNFYAYTRRILQPFATI